nr:hypothetical protein [Verrucomicrobium spinosum]
MTRLDLRQQLADLDLSHPHRTDEVPHREKMIALLDEQEDCFHRSCHPAHFTGSALVVSADAPALCSPIIANSTAGSSLAAIATVMTTSYRWPNARRWRNPVWRGSSWPLRARLIWTFTPFQSAKVSQPLAL